MTAADIDASLCSAEPAPVQLDDGFSPPAALSDPTEPSSSGETPAQVRLSAKSDF